MRRLLILLTALSAVVALTAATASANKPVYTLTLTATPSTLVVGDETLLSGALAVDHGNPNLAGYDVAIDVYGDEVCSTEGSTLDVLQTEPDGTYGGTYGTDAAGTYYVQASVSSESVGDVVSGCVPVTVAEKPVPVVPEPVVPETVVPSDTVASSYLCWNHEMVNPVAYTDKVADEMWKTGNYFEPQALLGNVAGGTNVGAYHLVCNAPSTLKPTGYGLGGSGEVYSPQMMQAYHLDHLGGNDLNLYHVFA